MFPELTPAQVDLVEAQGSLYVEACPGAGKTRAIVQRYERRASMEPRKGIVLLSFTNAAVDEVRTRCANSLGSLDAPHFVGTFDSFINRYISGPLYVRNFGKVPRFVESWDGMSISVRCDDLPIGVEFNLEWFERQAPGKLALNPSAIAGSYRKTLEKHADSCEGVLNERGSARLKKLIESGTMSSSASRYFAQSRIENPQTVGLIGTLLGNRFAEVIVDEAQDCSLEDLAILRMLQAHGVEIVLVADPDQSIYEFRRATPSAFDDYKSRLPQGTRLEGNFRSSRAICAFNDSLRYGQQVDSASGKLGEVDTPVQVLRYKNIGDVRQKVDEVLLEHAVGADDAIFVSHKKADARSAAGFSSSELGDSAIANLARASVTLRTAVDAQTRKVAIESVEKMVLRVCDRADSNKPLDGICEQSGISRRWLRDLALRLALAINPSSLTATAYAEAVRAHISKVRLPSGWVVNVNLLRAVSAAKWSLAGNSTVSGANWSTIHGVKGREFPAVAVVIPKKPVECESGKTALDHWADGTPSENRRVLYVGVSRAERLLMLVVHETHVNQLEAILARDELPYKVR